MPYACQAYSAFLTNTDPVDLVLEFAPNRQLVGDIKVSGFSGAACFIKCEFVNVDQSYALILPTFNSGISTVSSLVNFYFIGQPFIRFTALVNPVGPSPGGALVTANIEYIE